MKICLCDKDSGFCLVPRDDVKDLLANKLKHPYYEPNAEHDIRYDSIMNGFSGLVTKLSNELKGKQLKYGILRIVHAADAKDLRSKVIFIVKTHKPRTRSASG